MATAFFVILGYVTAALFLSWGYFRRYTITRPPLGVFNLGDVAILIGAIILVPYLYLLLPRWFVVGLLVMGLLSIHSLLWEPVLRARWAIWLATLLFIGVDGGVTYWFGAAHAPIFAVNNLVLVLAVVGVTNLWAQSGMKARDLAVLAGALMIYDVIATWQLPLMNDLVRRLVVLPFAPLVAWPIDPHGLWLAIGLGDLLLAAGSPLVLRKAFGGQAGGTALLVSLSTLAILLALPRLGILHVAFPVMVVLGPLILGQYAYWRHRHGPERTTRQYRHQLGPAQTFV